MIIYSNEEELFSEPDGMAPAWVYAYLKRNCGLQPQPYIESEEIICRNFIARFGTQGEKKNLITTLKAGWRQHKYREKQKAIGKQPCSFILSKGAIQDLKRLAKETNASLNETLEEIIRGTYHENKELKKQRRIKDQSTSRSITTRNFLPTVLG